MTNVDAHANLEHEVPTANRFVARERLVVFAAGAEMIGLMVFAFLVAIYLQVTRGVSEREVLGIEHHPSLTAHAVVAYIFLILVTAQLVLGVSQHHEGRLRVVHAMLGRAILIVSGIFFAAALWILQGRGFTNPATYLVFALDLLFLAFFLIRGTLAIRRGDVALHMDSMFGFYIILSRAAISRAFYGVLFLFFDTPPLTTTAVMVISTIVIYLNLMLWLALCGRLRRNLLFILEQLCVYLVVFAVLPWDFFAAS